MTESKYIVTSEVVEGATWLKKFIDDLGVIPIIYDSIDIFYINEGAIALTKESWDHKCSRNIVRKFHYIRELTEERDVILSWVASKDNPADPLTKQLS